MNRPMVSRGMSCRWNDLCIHRANGDIVISKCYFTFEINEMNRALGHLCAHIG